MKKILQNFRFSAMIVVTFILLAFQSVMVKANTLSLDEVVKLLDLKKHPRSNGYFKSIFVSKEKVSANQLSAGFKENKYELSDAIFYLIPKGGKLNLHKMRSEKNQYFLYGSPVKLTIIHENGSLQQVILGHDIKNGHLLHYYVPENVWFGVELNDPNSEYGLIACSVTPAWQKADYLPGNRSTLLQTYPQHQSIIVALTDEEEAVRAQL